MQADIPPVFVVHSAIEETIAAGEQPDWLLVRRDDVLILRRAGLPDLQATPRTTQDTPQGRTTRAAVAPGASLTLRHVAGVCRTARLGETHEFAVLTLPDGTVLRGCTALRGRREQ